MRLIIVSNRLPFKLKNSKSNSTERNIGGLATGIESYVTKISNRETLFTDYLWFGWSGGSLKKAERSKLRAQYFSLFKCCPIFLEKELVDGSYLGYCNKVIWPLFHCFPDFVEHSKDLWNFYQKTNESFYSEVKKQLKHDDVVWIHDYHLMLLPEMIRRDFPNIKINFFMHIPFPNYNMFRRLPNEERENILLGLLGADVVGFHTYSYAQDFLNCVFKVLNMRAYQNLLTLDHRLVKTDVFPMGIDYHKIKDLSKRKECKIASRKFKTDFSGCKIILSVDRLDYTKGILNRLVAFDSFLRHSPAWRGKVVMKLIAAPSRKSIDSYVQMKENIDRWVGKINGSYSTDNWIPVVYQFRQFDFLELCALYKTCDVALITPLCDGLNLITKEFIAAKKHQRGVLILSEMAGAIEELSGALSINPFNIKEIEDSIKRALEMDKDEIRSRSIPMAARVKNYDIEKWAEEMFTTTFSIRKKSELKKTKNLGMDEVQEILSSFSESKSSLFLLDYDGTLMPMGEGSSPSEDLIELLKRLTDVSSTKIVIVTGRKKEQLDYWTNSINVSFSSDFGAWVYDGNTWSLLKDFSTFRKSEIREIVQKFVDKLPNSYMEEKECAIVWDYRASNSELKVLRVKEILEELQHHQLFDGTISVLECDHSLMIRSIGSDKGSAASYWLDKFEYDFVLAIGDDDADEELFKALPDYAYSLRIGKSNTSAKYFSSKQSDVIELLGKLLAVEKYLTTAHS